MGVGIYGLIGDVIAVIPINELESLFVKKMETSKDFKTLVTAIQSPVFMVNIHCVYLNVSCCLFYMHTSM